MRARGRTIFLAGSAAAALAGPAAAQSFTLQPQHYLLSVDAADARALWLQPAGLARRREATVAAFAGGERDGAGGVTQYGAMLGSGSLGLAWQHDRRSSTLNNNTYSIGFSAGNERAGIGASRSWYHGSNTRDGSFTIGARYAPLPAVDASLVMRDIGSPVVMGDTVRATLLPAAAWNVLGGKGRLSAEWEIVTGEWGTSAVRAGASFAVPLGLVVAVRGDFAGSGDLRSLVFGLSWGSRVARVSTYAAGRSDSADPFGIYLATVRPIQTQRPRPGRM